MTTARSFFDGLWETLTGRTGADSVGLAQAEPRDDREHYRGAATIHPVGTPHCILHGYSAGDHRSCVINTGPYCNEPVTQGQIDEGDAHPIDERGVNDGKYEHVWCVQGGE